MQNAQTATCRALPVRPTTASPSERACASRAGWSGEGPGACLPAARQRCRADEHPRVCDRRPRASRSWWGHDKDIARGSHAPTSATGRLWAPVAGRLAVPVGLATVGRWCWLCRRDPGAGARFETGSSRSGGARARPHCCANKEDLRRRGPRSGYPRARQASSFRRTIELSYTVHGATLAQPATASIIAHERIARGVS